MRHLPECYGIIPARYASSRFPGKPMADILGKPMFWHVYQQARKCSLLKRVVLATDDERIFSSAEKYNIPVVMTREDHESGTDRVFEAATTLEIPEDSIVINIQGDEPAIDPEMLTELLTPFAEPDVLVTTLAGKISPEQAQNPNRVKVVFADNKDALYFSRSPIPFPRDGKAIDYYGHIGLYAFRISTLRRFVNLKTGILENTEKLEQLRLLENNIPIRIVQTEHISTGVDTPDDLTEICKLIS